MFYITTYVYRFSTHKAFQNQLSELNDIANQHELIAEELMSKVNKAILSFCYELKGEKKKVSKCFIVIFFLSTTA